MGSSMIRTKVLTHRPLVRSSLASSRKTGCLITSGSSCRRTQSTRHRRPTISQTLLRHIWAQASSSPGECSVWMPQCVWGWCAGRLPHCSIGVGPNMPKAELSVCRCAEHRLGSSACSYHATKGSTHLTKRGTALAVLLCCGCDHSLSCPARPSEMLEEQRHGVVHRGCRPLREGTAPHSQSNDECCWHCASVGGPSSLVRFPPRVGGSPRSCVTLAAGRCVFLGAMDSLSLASGIPFFVATGTLFLGTGLFLPGHRDSSPRPQGLLFLRPPHVN